MTMPYGTVEEPEVEYTMPESVPVHVVSSDKDTRRMAAEFGRWRTIIVSSLTGPNSATPGAQRLLNRSQRRHRARIIVNSSGNVTTTPSVAGFPSIATSGVAVQNPFNYPVQVTLAGFTATQVFVNGIQVGTTNGTYFVPAYGALSVTFTVLGSTTAAGIAQSNPQSVTDGVIVGGRDEIISGVTPVIGSLGGYLQIGDSLTYEAQAELWVCYPSTNTASVYVSVCDEVYAAGE